MCGSTSEQKDTYRQQSALFKSMSANYAKVFGASSAILKTLTDIYTPIFNAGPGQAGMSQPELAARNAQATEGTAQTYNKVLKATNSQIAAQGGGDAYIPSGAADQVREEVGVAAANQESGLKNEIQAENYSLGRSNWLAAGQMLGAAPSVMAPATDIGKTAVGSGSAAGDTANQMATAGNAWMGAVGGLLGNVAMAAGTAKACWIAEKIYGKHSFTTHLIRMWLNNVWGKQSRLGGLVMKLYVKYGKQVAERPWAVTTLTPLFARARVRAEAYFEGVQ